MMSALEGHLSAEALAKEEREGLGGWFMSKP